MGRPKKYVTPEEEDARREARRTAARERMQRLRSNPEYRAGESSSKRQRRAEDPEYLALCRERSCLSDRKRRESDPGYRVMRNFQRQTYKSMGGANGRFQREFLNVEFGHGCRVCDRLWFDVNLSTLNSVRDFEKRNVAVQVLREAFPAENDPGEMKVCKNLGIT